MLSSPNNYLTSFSSFRTGYKKDLALLKNIISWISLEKLNYGTIMKRARSYFLVDFFHRSYPTFCFVVPIQIVENFLNITFSFGYLYWYLFKIFGTYIDTYLKFWVLICIPPSKVVNVEKVLSQPIWLIRPPRYFRWWYICQSWMAVSAWCPFARAPFSLEV